MQVFRNNSQKENRKDLLLPVPLASLKLDLHCLDDGRLVIVVLRLSGALDGSRRLLDLFQSLFHICNDIILTGLFIGQIISRVILLAS